LVLNNLFTINLKINQENITKIDKIIIEVHNNKEVPINTEFIESKAIKAIFKIMVIKDLE
jgi:hypothetical protein